MIEDGVKGKEKLSFFNWQSWIRKYLKCASWILLKLYHYNFSGNFSVALSCINKYDVGWIDKKCQNRVNQARIRVLRTLMITEAFVFLWTSLRLMKKYEIKDQKYLSSHTRTWASEKEFKSFICISQLLSDEGGGGSSKFLSRTSLINEFLNSKDVFICFQLNSSESLMHTIKPHETKQNIFV